VTISGRMGSILVVHTPLWVWNHSPFFLSCLLGPWNPLDTSFPSMERLVSWWISYACMGYHLSSHKLLSCTQLMMNLVHCATSPIVLNTGKSRRFTMVELKRLMNSSFNTNYIPPKSSGATFQNVSMFNCGNRTWPVRSRSRSFTCLTFPLRSPTILIQGSHGSSITTCLETEILLTVALDIVTLDCQQTSTG